MTKEQTGLEIAKVFRTDVEPELTNRVCVGLLILTSHQGEDCIL
jgi:hypothetical protein